MPDVSSVATPRTGSPLKHVVGIGASAGGLEALEQMFLEMPSDTGMAFVVVQHLSPDFASMMDELLVLFDFRQSAEDAILAVRSMATAEGITLTKSIAEQTQPVFGDRSRMQQVFVNLLINKKLTSTTLAESANRTGKRWTSCPRRCFGEIRFRHLPNPVYGFIVFSNSKFSSSLVCHRNKNSGHDFFTTLASVFHHLGWLSTQACIHRSRPSSLAGSDRAYEFGAAT